MIDFNLHSLNTIKHESIHSQDSFHVSNDVNDKKRGKKES